MNDDWVDRVLVISYTPFPRNIPAYWRHGLVDHLGLPAEWPDDWSQFPVRQKAFFLFLDFFDPPANFQGLAHQLLPLRFVISEAIAEAGIEEQDEALVLLKEFVQIASDYIDRCPPEERQRLQASKLDAITDLGVWRFHFHCSQVLRYKVDFALDSRGATNREILNVRKLSYLRDGNIDPIYAALAYPIHCAVRRRMMLKQKVMAKGRNVQREEQKHHLIYNEIIACEHCVHFGHRLLRNWKDLNLKAIKVGLVREMRSINAAHRESGRKKRKNQALERGKSEPPEHQLIRALMPSISFTFRLLATFGDYQPTDSGRNKRAGKPRFKLAGFGRLIPPGRYEEVEESSSEDSVDNVDIELPLNILAGLFDDKSDDGFLKRSYGRRPPVAADAGESEDDYQAANTVDIPASWLVDPYRNAMKQRIQMESLITNSEPPIWSNACLRINSLKNYFGLASKAKPDLRLLCALQFHAGLDEDDDLRSMRIGIPPIFSNVPSSTSTEWGAIFVNPETFGYSYIAPPEMSAYTSESSPDFTTGCESSSRIISIRLPSVLESALVDWMLELKGKHGELNPVDADQPSTYPKLFPNWIRLAGQWQDLMAEAGRMSDENITPARLRSTFRALYVGQMGLSPLYANLIQKRIPIRYKAQHFYANLPLRDLWFRYWAACSEIYNLLEISDEG